MIVSIGIDIIEVARVREALRRTPRFAVRVFTEQERAYCDKRGEAVAAQHYAGRFAAKEAAFKALRTGWSGGLAWHDIEVVNADTGAPVLYIHGQAHQLFRQSGANAVHISISHTTEHAIAQVIFEKI